MSSHSLIHIVAALMLIMMPLQGWCQKADSTSTQWSYDLKGSAFIRDAEFFMPFAKGYTASGFLFEPTAMLTLSKDFSVRGGVRMLGVAGTDGLYRWAPIFSIYYCPNDFMQITMGTLDVSHGHFAGDPIYDPERWYFDYQENGLQILNYTSHWIGDTWVDWEHFLEPWTPDQERFTLGSHQIVMLNTFGSDFNIWIPLVFSGSHRGGQFSTLDTCIETLFNESIGIQAIWNSTHGERRIMVPLYFFQNKSPQGEQHTPFTNGWGAYPQLSLTLRNQKNEACITLGYWYGDHYLSARGGRLYDSYGWFKPQAVSPIRRMITAKVEWVNKPLRWGTFAMDAIGYYDWDLKAFDFTIGMKLSFEQRGRWK